MANQSRIAITIDRGGTFCDVWASVAGSNEEIVFKLLSQDPQNYRDAPTEGIRRVLEHVNAQRMPKDEPLDGSSIESVRIGTTVATNALLERKGERFALITTKGFKDLCKIGDQTRPKLFDLNIRKPDALYSEVVEIDERVTIEDYVLNPFPGSIDFSDDAVLKTPSGEVVRVLQKLDEIGVSDRLRHLYRKGYRSLAVCFLHSHVFPDHEQRVAQIARDIGFQFVSLSSDLSANIKVLQRATSACADAYLSPQVKKYVDGFLSGFSVLPKRVDFMQSDGGLSTASRFTGLKAILSGPAGGVVAIARTCYDPEEGTPIIGFDMGGTSTDISRFDKTFEHVFDHAISGTTITTPMLDVKTVAAGGGSILSWRNGLFVVGPESAGADPGPACYRKGGPLTITDANLLLGRLIPENFPAIFGPEANENLDAEIVQLKFLELAAQINSSLGKSMTAEEVASGFLEMANETMSRPIRNITESRGFATGSHNLASFGGAGGQHACAIARILGIPRIIIHKYSSILSAYGIGLADVVSEAAVPAAYAFSDETFLKVLAKFEQLKRTTTEDLQAQGVELALIRHECYLSMRYEGTDTNISILQPEDNTFEATFIVTHRREFAFELANRPIVVDAIRVRGIGRSKIMDDCHVELADELASAKANRMGAESAPSKKPVFLEGRWMVVPIYSLSDLEVGTTFEGPAMVVDENQTVLAEAGCLVSVLTSHLVIDLPTKYRECYDTPESVDPVQLSTFASRFMSIAEQMGHTLQRTAISTSIKERLDFSCALFTPDGKLVANAPHIPVHLGSMQFAIQYQHAIWDGRLVPGDVLLTNHPECGGTHLPDLTVVTPVFHDKLLIFYVASRGHHTDIGGIGVTSMIPDSKQLWQEGLAIKSMKIVSGGVFEEEAVRKAFLAVADMPGCSATRRLNDNISDLKAQIAANQRGIHLLQQMVHDSGVPRVQLYMYAIQSNAELAIRNLFKKIAVSNSRPKLQAIDYYDDGTPVKLTVTIDGLSGGAVFDFTGTGAQTFGNMNSPISITHSAVIYALRCMIDLDIPLNQGCLNPVDIRIPKGCILNPTGFVAVCGSTIASQRVTDVILRAFGICAASQGCANSFGWGLGGKDPDTGRVLPGWNYGEALGGGSGAGPGWHGTSAVQVHSTNTRTTDPEVIEKRTPVLVRRYEIRKGTGGRGKWDGGDGVFREIEAREPLKFSILSERRTYSPYGLEGGADGSVGKNYWIRRNENGEEELISLGGKAVVNVDRGERVIICTPGGGGWGISDESDDAKVGDVRPFPTQ